MHHKAQVDNLAYNSFEEAPGQDMSAHNQLVGAG